MSGFQFPPPPPPPPPPTTTNPSVSADNSSSGEQGRGRGGGGRGRGRGRSEGGVRGRGRRNATIFDRFGISSWEDESRNASVGNNTTSGSDYNANSNLQPPAVNVTTSQAGSQNQNNATTGPPTLQYHGQAAYNPVMPQGVSYPTHRPGYSMSNNTATGTYMSPAYQQHVNGYGQGYGSQANTQPQHYPAHYQGYHQNQSYGHAQATAPQGYAQQQAYSPNQSHAQGSAFNQHQAYGQAQSYGQNQGSRQYPTQGHAQCYNQNTPYGNSHHQNSRGKFRFRGPPRGPSRDFAGHKRKAEAIRGPQPQKQRKTVPPTAPSIPGYGPAILPQKPPPELSARNDNQAQKPKPATKSLGLTPGTNDPQYSSSESDGEEDDVDEEAMFAVVGDGLMFEHNGSIMSLNTPADLAEWREERKKNFPTKARIPKKEAERAQNWEERRRLFAEAGKALQDSAGASVEARRKDRDDRTGKPKHDSKDRENESLRRQLAAHEKELELLRRRLSDAQTTKTSPADDPIDTPEQPGKTDVEGDIGKHHAEECEDADQKDDEQNNMDHDNAQPKDEKNNVTPDNVELDEPDKCGRGDHETNDNLSTKTGIDANNVTVEENSKSSKTDVECDTANNDANVCNNGDQEEYEQNKVKSGNIDQGDVKQEKIKSNDVEKCGGCDQKSNESMPSETEFRSKDMNTVETGSTNNGNQENHIMTCSADSVNNNESPDDGPPESFSNKPNPLSDTKRYPCKFYSTSGYCRDGDACAWSHELTPRATEAFKRRREEREKQNRRNNKDPFAPGSKVIEQKKGIHQRLIDQEDGQEDKMALQVIKYLGKSGFFAGDQKMPT